MIQTNKNKLGPINTVEDIQLEKRRLKARIRAQEKDLRARVPQLPGELLFAGVNSFVPAVLSGKITTTALTFGKNLVNRAFAKKEGEGDNSKLLSSVKQMGVLTLLKVAFNAFMSKK
jgi:hypothetical protein